MSGHAGCVLSAYAITLWLLNLLLYLPLQCGLGVIDHRCSISMSKRPCCALVVSHDEGWQATL
eukprot:scaffold505593_cov40-Prasinocladus_malaysianus.AAC.2